MTYLLHQLLSTSAARYPHRIAVGFAGHVLTYAELDDASDRVAVFLRDIGVSAGDRVGLMAIKGEPAIISIFAILKAGAAYVPLDPHIPPVRAAFILGDCGVRVLIASPDVRDRSFAGLLPPGSLETLLVAGADASSAPEGTGARRVVGWAEALSTRRERLPDERIDTDLAYLLYTSGSTGEPKA